MKLRLILAVLSLFLSLFTSADHSSPSCAGCWAQSTHSAAVEDSFGVNIHFTDPEAGEMKMIADAGFRWVRMDFKWELTERERGKYDFAPYERLVSALEAHKLRPLFILDYGNPLYTEGKAVRTPQARAAFARWAAAAVNNFAGRRIVWEVFNEPNVSIFWPPEPNVEEYTALAAAVAGAVRLVAPNETLIGPAISGVQFDFLEPCFQAGLLKSWSAVSVHPYRQTNPETVAPEYARLRAMIAGYSSRAADPRNQHQPIFSGEWGYSSAWRGMNELKQADMLARQFLTNIANGVPVSIWYDWRDDGEDRDEPEHHFGLVRHQLDRFSPQPFRPKPAYLAAKTFLTQFRGYRFQQRLRVGSDEDYVLVFTNGSQRRFAAWTTSSSPHKITIGETSGSILLMSVTGEAAGTTAATAGIAIELTGSPVYISPLP